VVRHAAPECAVDEYAVHVSSPYRSVSYPCPRRSPQDTKRARTLQHYRILNLRAHASDLRPEAIQEANQFWPEYGRAQLGAGGFLRRLPSPKAAWRTKNLASKGARHLRGKFSTCS
jgi:hypothetical protein